MEQGPGASEREPGLSKRPPRPHLLVDWRGQAPREPQFSIDWAPKNSYIEGPRDVPILYREH